MEKPQKLNNIEEGSKSSMDRRSFCSTCFTCAAGMMLLSYPGILSAVTSSSNSVDEINPKFSKKEIRKLFMQKGSCSHLFFYLMNDAYEHNKKYEERAIDQLAGGLAEKGYQCGMLWGTSMGASAEIYRKYKKNTDPAITVSVNTSKNIIKDFTEITGSTDCNDITKTDPDKAFSKIKMIFSAGKCFSLAYDWYLKALKTTERSISEDICYENNVTACASEVVRKMGGNEEEAIMVSGFAGGLGLSGNACGALAAAVWMKTLDWCKEHPEERGYSYEGVESVITKFEEVTQGELLCHNICGMIFNSVEEHSEFIKNGGCKNIIETLAETKNSVD